MDDSEEWNQELQRHCEEAHMDPEETKEVQEGRKMSISRGSETSNSQIMGEELKLQITSSCRPGQMSENKVNRPEDAVVSEMIQQLPPEKIHIVTKCVQERFMGQVEAPSSWKIVKIVFWGKIKPDAEPKKGTTSYRAIALTSVKAEKNRIRRLQVCSVISKRLEKQRRQSFCGRFGHVHS